MNLFVFAHASDPEAAVVGRLPEGGPADWRYHEGLPLLGEFSRSAVLRYSRDYPDRRELRDFIPNALGVLIASPRVRQLLDRMQAVDIEYLPVRVVDHSGGVVAADYVIVNPLGGAPVIDLKRSQFTMGSLDKTQIKYIKRLALDTLAIKPGHVFMRAVAMRRLFLVQESVKASFEEAGITGWKIYPGEGWNGMYL